MFVGCTSTFTRNSDRKRHEGDIHQRFQLLSCSFPGCDHTTFRRDKIIEHIKRHYTGGRIAKRGDGSKQKGSRTTGMILSNMLSPALTIIAHSSMSARISQKTAKKQHNITRTNGPEYLPLRFHGDRTVHNDAYTQDADNNGGWTGNLVAPPGVHGHLDPELNNTSHTSSRHTTPLDTSDDGRGYNMQFGDGNYGNTSFRHTPLYTNGDGWRCNMQVGHGNGAYISEYSWRHNMPFGYGSCANSGYEGAENFTLMSPPFTQ